MDCIGYGSAAVTERADLTAQGYCRFRCRDCGRQFNERSDGFLNRASLPSDIIAFGVFCRPASGTGRKSVVCPVRSVAMSVETGPMITISAVDPGPAAVNPGSGPVAINATTARR